MSAQVPSDFVVQFSEVVSSSIDDETQALQYNVPGIGDVDIDTLQASTEPGAGEFNDDAEVFGALGIVGRPLVPETIEGRQFHAEVVCLRTADGLVPVATRDLRLKMPGGGPNEGTIALVGYGGGFYSLSPVDRGAGGTIHVMYCPYDFDSSGAPQKAHAIILDPTDGNQSIQVIHGEGMALMMSAQGDRPLLMKNASGDSTFRLDDQGITATAPRIVLSGGVIVGDPASASPLLAGSASQGSTKFFLSP